MVRRPAAWGAVGVIAMLALALPALGMRLGNPPDGGFPGSLPVVQTLDKIQQAFPEAPSPAQVVVTGSSLTRPAVRKAVAGLQRAASAHTEEQLLANADARISAVKTRCGIAILGRITFHIRVQQQEIAAAPKKYLTNYGDLV